MRRSKVINVPNRANYFPGATSRDGLHWIYHAMVRPGKKPVQFMVSFSQSWQSPSKTAKVQPAWRWTMFEPMPRNVKPAHPMVRVVDPDEEDETCDDTVCSWYC